MGISQGSSKASRPAFHLYNYVPEHPRCLSPPSRITTRTASKPQSQFAGPPACQAVKIRVERQTHLPADRSEAWLALKSLINEDDWTQRSAVFTALESIYRAECQQLGSRLHKAFKAANEALEDLSPEASTSEDRVQQISASLRSGVADAFASDLGASGTSQSRSGAPSDSISAHKEPSAGDELNAQPTEEAGKSPSLSLQQTTSANIVEAGESFGVPSTSEPASVDNHGASLLSIGSVDFEDASRLEFDRSRRRTANLSENADPQESDQSFLAMLLPLLRKAHFVNLSSRDEALARSLNADYVAQIFISPDTRRLDATLFHGSLQQLDIPEQAEAMLIFKRGYGQARRKGRMLVAKLDYLQYIVVRSFGSFASAKVQSLWQKVLYTAKAALTESKLVRASSKAFKSYGQQSLPGSDSNFADASERTGKNAAKQVARSGPLPTQFLLAGGGLFMTLSNWGLLPQVDVEPLSSFKEAWNPNEPARLAPVYVERISLRDALPARRGLNLQNMLGNIELVEPTFQELLVIYRRSPEPEWLEPLRKKFGGHGASESTPRYRRRSKINMRVYRDIPLPIWKVVFPDKLLQFRPLDGLRADLLTVAGLVAFIAQAKYDSIILKLITLASAVVLLIRVVLGYKRMNDRFDKMANEMLANTTVAGEDGVIEYIAASAALQQFEQTSLAYHTMLQSPHPLKSEGLCVAAEDMLEKRFQVRIRFDATEAFSELERLGLVEAQDGAYVVCSPSEASKRLKRHWENLLLLEDH